MAFGISRKDLQEWKQTMDQNEIAFLTHYWYDERFPGAKTITKVGCRDVEKLKAWGRKYGLKDEWIHYREDGYSHYDLIGKYEKRILEREGITPPLIRKQKEAEKKGKFFDLF
jgi:hypothetical protein